MRARVMGIEVEYSISHVPPAGTEGMSGPEVALWLVQMAQQELRERHGNANFWPNGSKVYCDQGHLEWAGPECRSAREAVIYDRAGERFVARLVEFAELKLPEKRSLGTPCLGTLFAAKTTVDAKGNSFGCHENYQIRRRTDLIQDEQEFFRYLTRHLTAFLVSRTVICGSGWLDSNGYQISQRAKFITHHLSGRTTAEKPIINTRDEVHGSNLYRRLHLILGDANMCEWATFLKVGSTMLVLEMIEDAYLSNSPDLPDPVDALKRISGDPALVQPVSLRNGAQMTAVAIQRWYLEAAKGYFGSEREGEARRILEVWEQTLRGLETDLRSLRGKLDWITKLAFLPSQQNQSGTGDDPRLREFDIKYHDVRQDTSIFYALVNAKTLIHSIVDDAEVERAHNEPPSFTRARVRGECVKRRMVAESWDGVAAAERSVALPDPLDWCPIEVLRLFGLSTEELLAWLKSGLASRDAQIRIQALRASHAAEEDARALAIPFMGDDSPAVRAEAASVIGSLGKKQGLDILRRATGDPSYLVRYQAENAMTALGSAAE